jgi:tRNA 2-thiouridine synthesizing protein A
MAGGRPDEGGRVDDEAGGAADEAGGVADEAGGAADEAGGVVVDARGLLCPAPVIALAKAARTAPAGTRITVLATDPAAAVDIPAWARMRGHTVLETKRETTKDGEQLVLAVLLEDPEEPKVS